jgi:HAD superfamily hydrolase (TIGR01549 family)
LSLTQNLKDNFLATQAELGEDYLMRKLGLVLDLDDTLYDAEAAYAYALKEVGIDSDSPDFTEARRTIKARLGEGHVGARNRILYFKQFLDSKKHYSHSAVLELMETYEKKMGEHIKEQWTRLNRKKLFEGRLAQIPKVILTNENLRTQMIKLRAIDPNGNLFPFVITSEEMGLEKPHLSLFQSALAKLKCEPKDCVMVGDSLETDMAPALKLGMKAFLTTEFRKPKISSSIPIGVRVLGSLDEIESLVL